MVHVLAPSKLEPGKWYGLGAADRDTITPSERIGMKRHEACDVAPGNI